jgi:hypothetical protein
VRSVTGVSVSGRSAHGQRRRSPRVIARSGVGAQAALGSALLSPVRVRLSPRPVVPRVSSVRRFCCSAFEVGRHPDAISEAAPPEHLLFRGRPRAKWGDDGVTRSPDRTPSLNYEKPRHKARSGVLVPQSLSRSRPVNPRARITVPSGPTRGMRRGPHLSHRPGSSRGAAFPAALSYGQ